MKLSHALCLVLAMMLGGMTVVHFQTKKICLSAIRDHRAVADAWREISADLSAALQDVSREFDGLARKVREQRAEIERLRGELICHQCQGN